MWLPLNERKMRQRNFNIKEKPDKRMNQNIINYLVKVKVIKHKILKMLKLVFEFKKLHKKIMNTIYLEKRNCLIIYAF